MLQYPFHQATFLYSSRVQRIKPLLYDNEQERNIFEATSPRKRNGPSAQGGDVPSSKRFRIITEGKEYKWNLRQDMVNYANENSGNYIP